LIGDEEIIGPHRAMGKPEIIQLLQCHRHRHQHIINKLGFGKAPPKRQDILRRQPGKHHEQSRRAAQRIAPGADIDRQHSIGGAGARRQ